MRFIAEASTIHGGSVDKAKELVWVAKKAGADTVKFQHVDPEAVTENRDWYKKVRFTIDQWKEIQIECLKAGMRFLCTPQTVGDFEDLLTLGILEVKVSADNFSNINLLERICEYDIDVFISINTIPKSAEEEESLNVLDERRTTLMYCVSEYPCLADNVKMKHAGMLKEKIVYHNIYYFCPKAYGLSDHTIGSTAAIMAVALGATVFEKHFRMIDSEGPDAGVWACYPDQLAEYFDDMRIAERMMG